MLPALLLAVRYELKKTSFLCWLRVSITTSATALAEQMKPVSGRKIGRGILVLSAFLEAEPAADDTTQRRFKLLTHANSILQAMRCRRRPRHMRQPQEPSPHPCQAHANTPNSPGQSDARESHSISSHSIILRLSRVAATLFLTSRMRSRLKCTGHLPELPCAV
jgi:hypothetical protein